MREYDEYARIEHDLYFFGSGTQMRNSTLRPAHQFSAAGSTMQPPLTEIKGSIHEDNDIYIYLYMIQ